MNVTGSGTSRIPTFLPRLASWALAAGALACVLAAVPSTVFDLDRHSVPKELVLHAAAALGALLALAPARVIRVRKSDAALAAWLGVGFLSALFASNPWLAARSFAVALSGAGLYWVARALSGLGLSGRVQGAMALATVAAAATALLQAYGVDLAVFADARAPGGTFGNRNFMAHAVALGVPTLVLLGLRAESGLRRRATWLGTAAVTAALVLSRTRAAWLAVAAAGAVSLLLVLATAELRASRELRRRALRLLLAAAAGAALAVLVPNRLDWRAANPYLESALGVVDYKSGSGKGRLIQYRNTLRMAADHPLLGVGPGNWPVEYPPYASRRDPSLGAAGLMPTNPWPSSDWVGFLVEWGPAGLGLLVAAAGSLWCAGVGKSRSGQDAGERLEGVTLTATATALLVVGALDAVLHLAAPSYFFWAAAGALAPPAPPWKTIELSGRRRAALLLGVLALGSLSALRSAGQLGAIVVTGPGWRLQDLEDASRLDPGSYRLRMLLAEGWLRRGRCDRAVPHARAASRLFPYLPDPRRITSQCGQPSPEPRLP